MDFWGYPIWQNPVTLESLRRWKKTPRGKILRSLASSGISPFAMVDFSAIAVFILFYFAMAFYIKEARLFIYGLWLSMAVESDQFPPLDRRTFWPHQYPIFQANPILSLSKNRVWRYFFFKISFYSNKLLSYHTLTK